LSRPLNLMPMGAANMHPPREAGALARKCHTDEQGLLALLPRLAQLVTLQDLINGIDTLAPTRLTFRGKPSRVWWSNVRDYRHSFFYRERPHVVAADAGIVLQVRPPSVMEVQPPDLWYCLFVLLDGGLHSIDLITNKLRNLIYYRECPERWGGEQSYYEEFPLILVLTTTKHRREHWQKRVMQLSRETRTTELMGAIISQEEITARENTQRFPWSLNWKALSREKNHSLQDLLQPIPPEAIPPGMVLPYEWQHLDLEDESLPTSSAKRAERPLPQVIEGHFAQRARQLLSGSVQGGNKQEQIALLGLSLSERQRELLQFILDCPMISTADMATLLNMKQASAERYIRDLRASGYLDLVDTERYQREIHTWAQKEVRENLVARADIGKRWQLSEQGMRVLAASQRISLRAIAIEKGEALHKHGRDEGVAKARGEMPGNEQTTLIQRASLGLFALRRVEHQSGIYSFFARLCRATQEENERLRQIRSQRRLALLWWEMGVFTDRRYQHLDQIHRLRPDAEAEYQYQEGATLRFWLEWDRNTMGTRDLQEKFETYLYYLGSKEYQVRDNKILPWILVVVPSPDQERRITRIAESVFEGIGGMYLRLTTTTRLEEKGALGEIWLPVLPTSPGSMQRCRFFEGGSRSGKIL
jgi:hypothetical protein